jgi:putative ABC transport system permease protein
MFLAVPTIYGAAALSLALGIGANIAIFSVVNGVLLRPLPYPAPDRLVAVWERDLKSSDFSRVDDLAPGLRPMAVPNFFDYREQNKVFDGIVGMSTGNATVSVAGHDTTKVFGSGVFANFFETLGVRPILGRTFRPEEEQAGHNKVVVISYGLWEEAYGKDPKVLGKKFIMEGMEHTVVGVMPPGFEFPKDVRFWHPTGFPRDMTPRNFNFIRAIARLKPGISIEAAQAQLSTMARRFEQAYPEELKNRGIYIVPLADQIVGPIRPRLILLLGVAGLVLLIVCGNVSNLLLARGTSRRREIAIRTALGAGRRRLMRQLLTESLLLIAIGGGLGLLLASWGMRFTLRLASGQIPRIESIAIDPMVLAFSLLVTLIAGLIAGLFPALQTARPDLTQVFNEGGDRGSAGIGTRRLGRLLVVLQLAMAMLLVCGAGLLVKSFLRLKAVDPGFIPDKVLTVEITTPAVKYDNIQKTSTFFKDMTRRIEALPGVRSAGFTFFLPMSGQSATSAVQAEGAPQLSSNDTKAAVVQVVTPGFFPSMGVPLRQGRLFTDRDDAKAPQVVILNEEAARRFWPGKSPLDRKVKFLADFGPAGKIEEGSRPVVGVVGDIRHYGLDQDVEPEIYYPNYQCTWRWGSLVVRTTGDPLLLVQSIRRELRNIDPDLAVGKVRTLEQILSDSVAKPLFTTTLMLIFALIALAVASIGVYGTVAYSVGQRTHELSVRMAVGAGRREVFRLVLREGVLLGLTGLVTGLIGALVLTRLMKSLLFDVSPLDPSIFVSVFLVLIVLVAFACFLPARRATRVDPLDGLRYE